MGKHTDILLEAGTNEVEIVVFFIEEDMGPGEPCYSWRFGVNVAKVLEIIRLPGFTAMPESGHPSVLGAFNQRSRVIPLVDLGVYLGINVKNSGMDKVLVTEFNNVTTSFKVSGVDRIHRLSWERIEAPDRYLSTFSDNSVIGVVRFDQVVIFLLDLEKIVAELNPRTAMTLDRVDACDADVHYKALIADDSNTVRSMIRQLLESACFQVHAVGNGRLAWDWLLEKKAQAEVEGRPISDFVEVVISDIEMPMMDGHNLTKRIKEDPALKGVPVILFSSLISDKLRHKGDSVGADLQVPKPDLGSVANEAIRLIKGEPLD